MIFYFFVQDFILDIIQDICWYLYGFHIILYNYLLGRGHGFLDKEAAYISTTDVGDIWVLFDLVAGIIAGALGSWGSWGCGAWPPQHSPQSDVAGDVLISSNDSSPKFWRHVRLLCILLILKKCYT